MSVDKKQAGRAREVTERWYSAEQDRAVAAVEDREPVSPQRCSHARVNRLDHLQQRGLIEEAADRSAGWLGRGRQNVRAVKRAGERLRQAGVPQPRRRCRLALQTAGAVEANADEIQ